MPDENKPAPSGSLFNFSLGDIFGAGKGIEKLMATVGGGAGRVADGIGEVVKVKWLDKSKADNEAYRTRVVGDAQTRVMEGRARAVAALAREGQHLQSMSIAEGGISAQLAGVSPETCDLYERTLRRMTHENVMQQLNRETVIAHAAAELAGDEQPVADNPVEPDWVTRLLRTVQDISNEEMQLIFGKILAGEIREPGSFSPRTISFLATLTPDEARSFRELCAFTWRELDGTLSIVFLSSRTGDYNINVLSTDKLQHLHDIGLIDRSLGPFATRYGFREKSVLLSYGDSLLEVTTLGASSESGKYFIEAGHMLLTKIGQELAGVCQPVLDPCIMEFTIEKWLEGGHAVACPLLIKRPDSLPMNR